MFSIKRCVRIAFQAVFVIVCIAGNVELTCAQSDVPPKQVTDVQQLKERIKLLEDTVQELKRQMATVEENQKPAATTTSQISTASKLGRYSDRHSCRCFERRHPIRRQPPCPRRRSRMEKIL
jgi:hypothetical protein